MSNSVVITDEAVTMPCMDCGKPVSISMDTLKRIHEQVWEPHGEKPDLQRMTAQCSDCAERAKGQQA